MSDILFPGDFREVMKEVALRKVPIEIVERQLLGFTHAESGRILAEPWRLPADISDVIEYHAAPEKQKTDKSLTAGADNRFGVPQLRLGSGL